MIASNRQVRIFRGLALLLLFAFQVSLVPAKPDSLATLESAIRKETEKKVSGFENRDRPRNAGLILISQLREAVDRSDFRQAEAALAEMIVLFESEAVRAAVNKVREELRVELVANEKEGLAKIRSVLSGASTAVKAARKPVDLDGAIRDLRNLPEYQTSTSPEIRKEMQNAQNARQFVLHWQDYLAAEAAGNVERAVQALQSASGITTDLIERSQILSRVEELSKRKNPDHQKEQARQIMAKVKSLDDIVEALDALAALEPKSGRSAGNYRGLVESLRLELSRISQVYQEYKAGLPTSLQIKGFDAPAPNEETFRTVLPLKVQLLRMIVARSLEVDESLKPSPEEPIRSYIDRMAVSAFDKGDVRLFVRARDLRRKLDGVVILSASAAITQSLVAGLNQEEAGQWAAAVVSYETALKYGADIVPAKHIGKRLDDIKAAHPKEFEQGFQRFMSGPQPVPQNPTDGAADKIVVPGAPLPVSPP